MTGELYLLPNLLGEDCVVETYFPAKIEEIVTQLDGLIAESEKGARRFLKRFCKKNNWREVPIAILSEHTTKVEVEELIKPLLQQEKWGLISDAGVPCIADPGASLVKVARQKNISIYTIGGPSSIFLALQISGLNAQKFYFVGYPPIKEEEWKEWIKKQEKFSDKEKTTLLFIETPYRTEKTLSRLIQDLSPTTTLAVAWNLTLPSEGIISEPIHRWRAHKAPPLADTTAIFLFSA